jgi:hypothetical protein
MAEIRGMQMPEPSSGGGGGLTNQLMGIFRERSRAQRQLELMAYQSAMNVAGSVAKTKLGSEAISEAMQGHYERVFDPEGWKSEDARKLAQQHLEQSGIRSFGPGRFEAQARGEVISGGVRRSRGSKRQDVPEGSVKKRTVPTVNDQPQTVAAPNVGDRTPAPSKGGFVQPAMFTESGATTKAAMPKKPKAKKAGTVTPPATGTAPVAGAKPRVKKPGLGQTPNNPPMGGMNA